MHFWHPYFQMLVSSAASHSISAQSLFSVGDLSKFWTTNTLDSHIDPLPSGTCCSSLSCISFSCLSWCGARIYPVSDDAWVIKMVQQNVCKPSSVNSWWQHAAGITYLYANRKPPSAFLIPLSSSDVVPLQTVELFLLLAPWRLLGHPLRYVIPYLSRQCSEKWIPAWLWGNNISLRPCQPAPNVPCPQNVVVSCHVISLHFYGRCRQIFHQHTLLHGASWSIFPPPRYSFFTDSCTSTAGIYLLISVVWGSWNLMHWIIFFFTHLTVMNLTKTTLFWQGTSW